MISLFVFDNKLTYMSRDVENGDYNHFFGNYYGHLKLGGKSVSTLK